jgi:hypothetical protein
VAHKTPTYDYDADPKTPRNQSAAQANGWTWDSDWHDHKDTDGFYVHGPYHPRPQPPLDPTALK